MESVMIESEKIVFEIIKQLYPEWIQNQKGKYYGLEEFDQYKQILLNTFGYNIERMALEQERNVDTTDVERKIEIMKLIKNLRDTEKKGKRK